MSTQCIASTIARVSVTHVMLYPFHYDLTPQRRSVALGRVLAHGYWHKPAETGETFVDRWCRTGDLVRVTPDGFLVLTGRAKDMTRSGGENIYPAEVQGALAEHPHISAVAVIGVPHARCIEVGCAVIVPTLDASGLAEASVLQEFLDHRLASYKRPKHFVFVTELPLGAAGKLQKQLLRSQCAALGSTV